MNSERHYDWLEWVKDTNTQELRKALATREALLYSTRTATDYELAAWREERDVIKNELAKRNNG